MFLQNHIRFSHEMLKTKKFGNLERFLGTREQRSEEKDHRRAWGQGLEQREPHNNPTPGVAFK